MLFLQSHFGIRPARFGNCRIDQLQPYCLEPGEGADLISLHKTAVADDVRRLESLRAGVQRSGLAFCGGPALDVENVR